MPGPISREAASRKRLLEAIFSGHGGDVGSLPDFYKPQAAPQPAAPQAKPQAQKRQPGQKSAYIQQLEAEMKANQAAELAANQDPFDQQLADLMRQRAKTLPNDFIKRVMPNAAGSGYRAPGFFGEYAKKIPGIIGMGPDETFWGANLNDLSPEEEALIQEAQRRRYFSSMSELEQEKLLEKFRPK